MLVAHEKRCMIAASQTHFPFQKLTTSTSPLPKKSNPREPTPLSQRSLTLYILIRLPQDSRHTHRSRLKPHTTTRIANPPHIRKHLPGSLGCRRARQEPRGVAAREAQISRDLVRGADLRGQGEARGGAVVGMGVGGREGEGTGGADVDLLAAGHFDLLEGVNG